MRKLRDQYMRDALRQSVQVMRAFCDQAEHAIEADNLKPLERIEQVTHSLAWGMANAQTGIDTALSACGRAMTYELEEPEGGEA